MTFWPSDGADVLHSSESEHHTFGSTLSGRFREPPNVIFPQDLSTAYKQIIWLLNTFQAHCKPPLQYVLSDHYKHLIGKTLKKNSHKCEMIKM